MRKKILVIAPHPDDEVLGCGGTIAKSTNKGDLVDLCIVTKAYTPDWSEEFIRNRENEIKRVIKVLGISRLYLLGYPTIKLDTIPQKDLNNSLREVVEDSNPNVLYLPHKGDLNKDHRLVFEAGLVVSRPLISSIEDILSYETLSETEWGRPLNIFNPNIYVDISDFIGKKIRAMKIYNSELKQKEHPRSIQGIKTLGKLRGSEVGVGYAEAFELIRGIK